MLGDEYGYIRPPRPAKNRKKEWENRLANWKDELETNAHGMQYVAQRCVNLLEAEIAEFWPQSDT